MEEGTFRDLLRTYLLPMVSGTRLGGTKVSKPSHALVAYEHRVPSS